MFMSWRKRAELCPLLASQVAVACSSAVPERLAFKVASGWCSVTAVRRPRLTVRPISPLLERPWGCGARDACEARRSIADTQHALFHERGAEMRKEEQQYVEVDWGKSFSWPMAHCGVHVFSSLTVTYDFIEYLVRLILAELHGVGGSMHPVDAERHSAGGHSAHVPPQFSSILSHTMPLPSTSNPTVAASPAWCHALVCLNAC